MLDAPVESTYLWLGLATVGTALVALALTVPSGPPPDATAAARTVDSVAASPYEATARHPLDAARMRLGAERLGLRSGGGEAHAAFAYDRIVPVTSDGQLEAVLYGTPPEQVFANRTAFQRALNDTRTVEPRWQPAPAKLLVRRVTWGETNGTLVGA